MIKAMADNEILQIVTALEVPFAPISESLQLGAEEVRRCDDTDLGTPEERNSRIVPHCVRIPTIGEA